eukprot:CAMPEP_0115126530 /NCGR_PEP_ID=MMETSP0227-20121206/49798_1 /TAXON_ID=89957 /ORGANISM="Polarella glacialis, Strain CCMP 1383" /LENGTH=36 /DNA_ID= /DNA_START= /DNA_END= /DNA_ORIENTATION=
MVAARDLEAGETLLLEQPVILFPLSDEPEEVDVLDQ